MCRDFGACDSSMRSFFVELNTTLRFHLHTLLSFEKILWMTAEKGAVDRNLLTLEIHSLVRLIGVESNVAPVQAWELFVVVEVVLALNHGREILRVAFPLDGHHALDETGAARDEGFNKVLNRPCSWESLNGEVTGGESTAQAGSFVETDVVKAAEVGAVAETEFALYL